MSIVTAQQRPREFELERELVARSTDAFVGTYKIAAGTVQVRIQEFVPDSRVAAGPLHAGR